MPFIQSTAITLAFFSKANNNC